VWEFNVEVTDDKMKQVFIANTGMSWSDFMKSAYERFNNAPDDIRLGYRIRGDMRAMSHLSCEYDWGLALENIKERVNAARTRAVGVELRNVVSENLFELEKENLHLV
jgi:hypothetical protein